MIGNAKNTLNSISHRYVNEIHGYILNNGILERNLKMVELVANNSKFVLDWRNEWILDINSLINFNEGTETELNILDILIDHKLIYIGLTYYDVKINLIHAFAYHKN